MLRIPRCAVVHGSDLLMLLLLLGCGTAVAEPWYRWTDPRGTAPISPGSSGGGLFDARGNLIRITTSTRVNSQNINFAIPAEGYWR